MGKFIFNLIDDNYIEADHYAAVCCSDSDSVLLLTAFMGVAVIGTGGHYLRIAKMQAHGGVTICCVHIMCL